MTRREELLSARKRNWNEELHNVQAVYVLPNRYKHDSGWACMDFVATFRDKEPVRFGGGCDVVLFRGLNFSMDCEYGSRIIRIFNHNKGFMVGTDASSIYFFEED